MKLANYCLLTHKLLVKKCKYILKYYYMPTKFMDKQAQRK